MKTLRYYILFIAFTCAQITVAQVSFEATVKRDSVPLNKHIEVSFTMNQDGENFTPPPFKNFIIANNVSLSMGYAWIGGKKGLQKTYSYQLLAKKQGELLVESASIMFEGITYKTKPINIFITDSISIVEGLEKEILKNIHYITEATTTTPYIGEMVILNHKVITNTPLYSILESETEKSILPLTYNLNDSLFYHKTNYKGKETYYVNTTQEVFAFTKVGHKSIPPQSIFIEIMTEQKGINSLGVPGKVFFDKLHRAEYSTQGLIFKVKDLPKKNKPKHFLNAIGSFDIKIKPSSLQVKKGESLDVKVQVSGEGNLYLLEMPLLTTTMQETPKPNEEKQIDVVENRIVGTKTNTYTFIPQETGNFVINPIEFSYFDPKIKKYKTIRTEMIKISVIE
ncbi:BatD family protein [Myroides marinus]|uniref:BatD family protein n=1 Tax=Myroides marinus TaxID=703342 RepID=UPI002576FDAE|nr:BatD family protein [Myroides marinus]MDM1360633.1 BatD family protein [Myroides marinus]